MSVIHIVIYRYKTYLPSHSWVCEIVRAILPFEMIPATLLAFLVAQKGHFLLIHHYCIVHRVSCRQKPFSTAENKSNIVRTLKIIV